MNEGWKNLDIPDAEFDVLSLQAALDEKRLALGLSWAETARRVNRERAGLSGTISASTLSTLANKRYGIEGEGVLQMLLWLERSPESFVPAHPGAFLAEARLPLPPAGCVLRFDTRRLHALLEAQRSARGLSWNAAADEVGGFMINAASLRRLQAGGRTGFPWVMRMTRWLKIPAAAITRIAPFCEKAG